MLSIGTELQGAIEAYEITAISFLTLGFTDGALNITEAPRPITHNSVDYLSSSNLLGVAAPNTQNAVDRDNYSVIFADNDSAMRRRFETNGPTGVPLSVKLGFLDDDDNLISELLDVYTGQSSVMVQRRQGDGQILEVGFTGQLTQLDAVKILSTTPESRRQIDPSDTSMRHVHDGVLDSGIKWGRKD